MLLQLAIGSLVIALNAAIQAELFNILHGKFSSLLDFCRRYFHRLANTAAITLCVLYILMVHTVQVWVWAGVLRAIGAIETFEPALYFSLVSFSTIGYGDIVLTHEWRLLGAMIGANGLLMFGWSTAYMVDLVRRTA